MFPSTPLLLLGYDPFYSLASDPVKEIWGTSQILCHEIVEEIMLRVDLCSRHKNVIQVDVISSSVVDTIKNLLNEMTEHVNLASEPIAEAPPTYDIIQSTPLNLCPAVIQEEPCLPIIRELLTEITSQIEFLVDSDPAPLIAKSKQYNSAEEIELKPMLLSIIPDDLSVSCVEVNENLVKSNRQLKIVLVTEATTCSVTASSTVSNTPSEQEDERHSHNLMSTEDQQKEFDDLWQARKATAEESAERNARVTFRQWQRDRLTLEQAIDASLKEYAEVYERAHALRLMFEEEKAQWSCKIQHERVNQQAEESPCWSAQQSQFQRQRITACWDGGYQPQHEVSPSPYPFGYSQCEAEALRGGGALVDEFQYAAEEEEEGTSSQQQGDHHKNHNQQGSGGHLTQQVAQDCSLGKRGAAFDNAGDIVTPQKKLQKKFTVPVKMT